MKEPAEIAALSDDDLMEQWTAVGDQLIDAKAEAKAYSAEFHRREAERQDAERAERRRQAEAGERDASLDQTVGSVEA